MGRSSIFQVLSKRCNGIRLSAWVVCFSWRMEDLEWRYMYTHTHTHTSLYICNCKSGERMEEDNDQRNSREKKCQEKSRVRQWTEVRCQNGDRKTWYKNRDKQKRNKKMEEGEYIWKGIKMRDKVQVDNKCREGGRQSNQRNVGQDSNTKA